MVKTVFQYGSWLWHAIVFLNGSSRDVVLTPPTWGARFGRWLIAFSLLLLVYELYALVVVPWIEPALQARRASVASVGPTKSTDPAEFSQLFAEGAWERKRPKVLETQGAKLLFQDYRPSPDGRMVLHPCTVIFISSVGDRKSQRPIVLQAPDGALLNFAGPLNLARAEFSHLKNAKLSGEVTIFSPPSRAGADDAFEVVTRNVQISPRQIWTPHDVRFKFGAHHGSGRDLSITLAPVDEDALPNASTTQLGNLQLLELVHVDKIVIQTPGQGVLSDASRASRPNPNNAMTAASRGSEATQIEITCQGPFQFDFPRGTASFEDLVDVVSAVRNGPSDQLNCERLLIHFDLPDGLLRRKNRESGSSASEPVSPKVLSPKTGDGVVRRIVVRRIEALGHPVQLRAPSFEATARGKRIAYDFTTRRVLLEGDESAHFTYQQHRIEAPTLEYELNVEPKRLGRLWAAGPGTYHGRYGDNHAKQFQATWNGDLQLQPQDDLHVLSVTGGAQTSFSEMGQFSADQLYIWLAEIPRPETESAGAPTEVAPSIAPASGPELSGPEPATGLAFDPAPTTHSVGPNPASRKKYEVQPVKMLAHGHVHADSDMLDGQTQRLEVWFDHEKPFSDGTTAPQDRGGRTTDTGRHPGEPVDKNAQKPKKKIEVSGKLIRLWIQMATSPRRVREATITGLVRFSQRTIGREIGPPLSVTGDQLQLRTDRWNRASVDVLGQPARVAAQGMSLEGKDLHVSQRENRMWANGPGRMMLPASSKGAERNAAESTPIWISWQGGMDFDGQLVRFLTGVDARTVKTLKQGDQLHFRATGDQLHALLSRYVSLEHARNAKDLDVVELRFLGNVISENQTMDVNQKLVSRDKMQLRDFTLDRKTGDFRGSGPGWITSTRLSRGDINASVIGRADRARSAGADKIIYLRVDFQNAATGNMNRRELEFQYYVRTVYGPVNSWDQVLDPTHPGGLGTGGFLMTSDRLVLADMGRDKPAVEMQAIGKTTVEGSTFTAKADRLSYAQAKQRLVLEGTGRNFALLEHRMAPGQRPSSISARKIMYWPKTGQYEIQGGRSGDYTHYGSSNMPSARLR